MRTKSGDISVGMFRSVVQSLFIGVFLSSISLTNAYSEEAEENIFATVNGEVIPATTYYSLLRNEGRNKFYHGRPPEETVVKFRKEIAERIITETLFSQEAIKQNISADEKWVDEQVEHFISANKDSKSFSPEDEEQIGLLRKELKKRSQVERLKEQVRESVKEPTTEQARQYYNDHLDKFTTPEQTSVSIILLKVQPWAGSDEWASTKERAQLLYDALKQGGDFAQMAKDFSDDGSASNGGALGFIHKGMLGAAAQEAVDKLEVNQISEPVVLLEGVAILKLDERREAKVNPFSSVKERVAGLWLRERKEQAYNDYKAELRKRATITIQDEKYLSMINENNSREQTEGEGTRRKSAE